MSGVNEKTTHNTLARGRKKSGYLSGINGGDTAKERERGRSGEAAAGEEEFEGLTPGELLDTLAEVIVRGGIACKEAGNAWEDVVEVEAVGFCDEAIRHAEVQHEEVTAGAQDAAELAERFFIILHIAQAKGNGGGVEAGIRQRKMHGIGLKDIGKAAFYGNIQHGAAKIRPLHRDLGQGFFNRERQVPGTGGDIEQVAGFPLGDNFDSTLPPQYICP